MATTGSANGLDRIGEVRLLELPHTGANCLQREMGYRVARKHAAKLRRFSIVSAFGLPFALVLLGLILPQGGATVTSVLAALICTLGVVVERWLFFAEAEHVVNLYYSTSST